MTTLFKKVGRRYRPVAEHDASDSYPEGAHLVICQPGSTTRRFGIEPDRAGLLAAAEPLREKIKAIVVEKMRMRPTKRPLTPEQRRAWETFKGVMGQDGYMLEYPSVAEVADAVVDLILGAKR